MNNKKLERKGLNIIKEATSMDDNGVKEYIEKEKGIVNVMILTNSKYEYEISRL